MFCTVGFLVLWAAARASMWADPDWEQMLKESELIALIEVTEGGKFIAKVRPLNVFKGEAASEFYAAGYNDQNWPKEAIQEQSFRKHQRYYLFLQKREVGPGELAFLNHVAQTSGDPEWKKLLQEEKSDAVRHVWTPSAGHLPVEGEKVHYSLLQTSYPHAASGRNCAEFERFLKAAIAYQVAGQSDTKLVEETLRSIRKQSQGGVGSTDKESDLAHTVAAYFLLGGRSYDEAFERIATGDDTGARFMLARLLGAIVNDRADKLLLTMLSDKNSVVQGEVVRQLAKGKSDRVGEVLLGRLEGAGEGGVYPHGIMDPVRNQLDGGKIEIIRSLGELKYEKAAPALIRLLEVTEDEYSLDVLLQALDKMGNRDYPRALEKPLAKEPLIYKIAEWTKDHHLTELRGAFEQVLDHPLEGVRRPIDLSAASRALGAIGDSGTGAKLASNLDELSSKKVAEVLELDVAKDMIGALAELHYKPARSAVARSFFYWFGIDSAFATKPELLKTKEELQCEVEGKAKKFLSEFRRVDAEALVFLQNRVALVNGSETNPNYSFALEVGIRSQEHSELKADSLQARLVKAFGASEGSIGVTRWIHETYGESSGGNDARLGGRSDSLFLWRWAQYVQATRDPEDLRFAKFLLESGLAERWDAKKSIEGVFGSAPIE